MKSTAMHPSHFSLEAAIRPTILALPTYITSTSDEFQARASILMDANENSLGSCLAPSPPSKLHNNTINDSLTLAFSETTALHRYPSASQWQLKRSIAEWRGIPDTNQICLGVGSSGLVDQIIRMTCTPFKDAIMVTPPTFNLYQTCAALSEIGVVECPLELSDNGKIFTLRVEEMLDQLAQNQQVKVIFIVSPGNPTGTLISLGDIKRILDFPDFKGIVVVDEAYIDFSQTSKVSALSLLSQYANLLVLQTLSKAHGLAGLRLGMAFAHPTIIELLKRIQVPYSVSSPTSALAMLALSPSSNEFRNQVIAQANANRQALIEALADSEVVEEGVGKVLGGNSANFIVLPILERGSGARDNLRAKRVSESLKSEYDIAVRFIGGAPGCEGCLRITIGTEEENEQFLKSLIAVLTNC